MQSNNEVRRPKMFVGDLDRGREFNKELAGIVGRAATDLWWSYTTLDMEPHLNLPPGYLADRVIDLKGEEAIRAYFILVAEVEKVGGSLTR